MELEELMMSAAPALNLISAKQGRDVDYSRFFALLDDIVDWCKARTDRIKDCYIELAPDGLALYVVGKSNEFDFDLNKELADLAVSLTEKKAPIYASLVPASVPVEPDAGLVLKVQL
jgi:hypothetical protein